MIRGETAVRGAAVGEGRTSVCVLVVEDEPSIMRLVSLVLEDLGCEPLTAPDAETAMAIVRSQRPHLILADVRLPGMDGVEFTRRVKSDPELRDTPVLLMSAYGEPPGHPGDDFLPKPFDIESLTDFVTPYIDRGRSVAGA